MHRLSGSDKYERETRAGKGGQGVGKERNSFKGAGLTEEGSLEQSLRKGCVCVSPLLRVAVSAVCLFFVFQALQYLSYDLH